MNEYMREGCDKKEIVEENLPPPALTPSKTYFSVASLFLTLYARAKIKEHMLE